jgi:argininosuccinate lyase
MLRIGLARVRLDPEKGRSALQDGSTAATDVAEALAQSGVPFRTAYRLTGKLVRACLDRGIALSAAPLDLAKEIDPRFTAEALRAADASASISRKRNAGGTGPASIEAQISFVRSSAGAAQSAAAAVPRLSALLAELKEAPL